MKTIARNKKAFYDYEIIESFEAGIVLKGSEVKAIRASKVNLKDSFIRVIRGEVFLLNAHISFLQNTHTFYRPDERGARKLLMHKKQIDRLSQRVTKDGLTIVPLSIYLNDKNIIKANIALARGKKLYDKREDIKRKDLQREAKTALSNNLKGKI